MAKPTVLPLWNTAEERVLAPSATQQATGWIWTGSKYEKPKGEVFNYWMNNVYKWIKYFDEEVVPSSPIATSEEYTATGGETFVTTSNNTNLQVYKNGTFLIKDTDYTINVDGVTVDLTVALNVSDFVQWYDLRKLERSYINRDINSLTNKANVVNADELVIADSESSFSLKKLSLSNLKANITPAGSVIAYPSTSAPGGYLECNGAALSRTTYSDLFAVIGTTYGAGNGSTTFNIPDLRGEFIRGFDNGRGVDGGRAIGTEQISQANSIENIETGGGSFNEPGVSNIPDDGNSSEWVRSGQGGGSSFITIRAKKKGVETRPRNIAMMYCIKY